MSNELHHRFPAAATLVDRQSWSDATLLALAIHFIDEAAQGDAFTTFLGSIAASENGETTAIVHASTEATFAAGLVTLASDTATRPEEWTQVPRQPASGRTTPGTEERWYDHTGQGIAASICVRDCRVVAIENQFDETVRA